MQLTGPIAGLLLVLTCMLPNRGQAEDRTMPNAREAMDYLAPDLMADARPRWRAADLEGGAVTAGFLAWPSLAAGVLVDSNPLQAHNASGLQAGLRLTPRLVAERESGVHATAFYGWADARLYPARPDANQLDGRVGILHDWAPRRDLVVRLQGDLAQARDVIDSRQLVTGTARGRPFTVRDATLSGSVQKTFGAMFVSTAADLSRSTFAEADVRGANGRRALSDQTGADLAFRVGAKLGPALTVFAEPSANWHVLEVGHDESNGTRIVAGLGTARIGLLGGALFAGVQHQAYTRDATRSEPVFGGRLAWWPTPAWTVSLTLDRRLAQAAVGTAAEPLGTPVDAISEIVTVHFAPARAWWSEAGLRHETIAYLTTGRRDDLITGSLAVGYLWRHDLSVTADLSFTDVTSSIALASYDRAQATLGAFYVY